MVVRFGSVVPGQARLLSTAGSSQRSRHLLRSAEAMTTTTSGNQTATILSETASAEPISAQDPFELRRKKILECADQALAKSNALEATLELVATDLMQYILWLREDIERARAVMADPLESLRLTLPVSEQLYKMSKQLHAYADLLMRLKRSRTDAKARRPNTVLRLKSKKAK
jgi:hypothetical protein